MSEPDSHADVEARIEQIKQALTCEIVPQERLRLIDALCEAALALAVLPAPAKVEMP